MTEAEIRRALERVPPDLRRLFLWFATGQDMAAALENPQLADAPVRAGITPFQRQRTR